MSEFLLHSATRESLRRLLASPVHAIGIQGRNGSGKNTMARHIAGELLGSADIGKHPYALIVDCSVDTGIDEIREAIKFLSLSIPGTGNYKRCLIFLSFEGLGREAQNALLKSLEEPPRDTLIILTTESRSRLPATIVSRLRWLDMLTVGLDEAQAYFGDKFDGKAIETAHALSGGSPALMQRLLSDYDNDPLVKYINLAKQSLSQDKFTRLASVETMSKDKDLDIGMYLEALSKIMETALKRQVQKDGSVNRKLVRSLESVALSREALAQNANKKLILTDIFYNL